MNLNKALIIGNLTRDPELRTLPSGKSVVSFSVATNRTWLNQAGEKQQEVQFHNIVSFGKQAEVIKQYMTKGSIIFIEGRIQTRTWEAQDGAKRSRTEIVIDNFQFGPKKGDNPNHGGNSFNNGGSAKKEETLDTIEYPDDNNNPDDIPF
ncbi:MAG: single-stranded DNA-binding protein [bacterium]|nr:single-stranded DNA-binding protein [bacterium]